jgi:hypothetical protein
MFEMISPFIYIYIYIYICFSVNCKEKIITPHEFFLFSFYIFSGESDNQKPTKKTKKRPLDILYKVYDIL